MSAQFSCLTAQPEKVLKSYGFNAFFIFYRSSLTHRNKNWVKAFKTACPDPICTILQFIPYYNLHVLLHQIKQAVLIRLRNVAQKSHFAHAVKNALRYFTSAFKIILGKERTVFCGLHDLFRRLISHSVNT